MKKYCFFAVLVLFSVVGCRSKDELPEVRPLPEKEPVKVTLEVNVNDNKTPEKTAPAAAGKRAAAPEKTAPAAADKALPNPMARKTISLPPEVRSSAIDSDLNSVERSYVQEIRSRHKKSAEANEKMIFGSFKPGNLIKGGN